ncbi:MAG: phosphoglycerate dehydrogenase [Lachnospiraceae bacterium]|nr:phosphoglycerate dehydrogenase [Lachnospiraceae bacterium]
MADKILIGGTHFSLYGKRAKAFLEKKGYEVVENTFERPFTQEELKQVIPEISGALVGCEVYSREILDLASRLKVLVKFGVGLDNIDLEYAREKGVKVANARGQNADSVAELTLALVLGVYRNIRELEESIRGGGWSRAMGHTIHRKTIGLIGFGATAQYVARLFRAYEPEKIYAVDPYGDEKKALLLGVELTKFDTILEKCDIITIHVPAIPETVGMFGPEQFKKMKKSAILINIARGSIVNEKALYEALVSGEIAGAGLDVFEKEPTDKDNPLFSLEHVVVTPHSGAETYETYDAISMFGAKVITDVIEGRVPENWVNP